jgi:hypothetical protein
MHCLSLHPLFLFSCFCSSPPLWSVVSLQKPSNLYLYFRTVHVVIFILFKLTHTHLSVGCLVVHNQTSHRQVHQARTHIDNIQSTYQINNLTTQTSREGSNSTKHEGRPPEDGQTIVTETCTVLMMCFTNIFNNLVF